CLMYPGLQGDGENKMNRQDFLWPGLAFLLLMGFIGAQILWYEQFRIIGVVRIIAISLVMLVAFVYRERPLRFALFNGAIMLAMTIGITLSPEHVAAKRSFFGISIVKYTDEKTAMYLQHGTTVHGIQLQDPAHKLMPT